MKYLLPAALILCLWQSVVWVTDVPAFILPPPAKVAVTLWGNRALLAEHAIVTLSEVMIGLLLGTILGMVTALGLAMAPRLDRWLKPVLVLSQSIPVFALAPILTLWFGYGLWSKIMMALLIIYFPVTSAFHDALVATPPAWLRQAEVMGGTRWRVLWFLRVPAALPGLMSGLRLAAVYAPIGAIIGEWVGASRGLGYLMLLSNGRAKTDLMFAAVLVVAVMTVLLHAAVNRLACKIENKSRGQAEPSL